MDDRTSALRDIAAIARRHGLSAGDIAAALGEAPAAGRAGNAIRARTVMVRVLGFLGGTFIFAGLGVFIALRWSDMNSASRVVITLGPGVAAFLLAVLSHRDRRFDKVTAPLFLIAAALEPTGMFVAFEEYGSGGDWRLAGLITSATMALQFAGAFGSIRRSTPLFFALLFATLFSWTALDLLGADDDLIALIIGGSMLLAAVGLDRTAHSEISPFWYLLGSAAFLKGVFDLVESTPFEITFLAVAAGFVYLSVLLRSRALLLVATLAILSYTGWFTRQHFADSVGWPIALIVFGFAMIGLSALAFRIDRDYVRAG
jgi:predicted membrane protein DUF2157